ncbi:ABC transporter permease [Mesorhizobium sp.]|uniref:ABC transporter permease n=1 Tax=Mesorhizobium sp. TaxID=1871066 RepID=UPI000FE57389|nr:ABC transporter permease [Mesorhizobium sp.]RWI16602.1 MAG: ABC transporter permease [Mesorhizobium sp.]RWN07670.1 MAG: ABC transporter permease [Mesorhizobium sp.]RWN12412.1 MAG: ABC transporter permease [Mesorhizobium sp.]TIQ97716.1 MAG: ABC transporter permease [Mesorhizobium sp.]
MQPISNYFNRQGALLSTAGPVILLLGMVIIFTFINPRFLSWINLFNLMRQSSILLVVATGMSFVILMGAIDLSVGAIVTLVGVSAAVLVTQGGLNAFSVAVSALGIGALCGALNALLVLKLRLPSFVATLGTMTIVGGISTWISGGVTVFFRNPDLTWIASGSIIGRVPNSGVLALIIFALASFVGTRSQFGRSLSAIGGGGVTARLSGIDVLRTKAFAFIVSGLLCGTAGLLLVSRTSTGTAHMGDDLLLQAIAAVVMGGTALSGGSGGVHRTLTGVLVIAVFQNGLTIAGIHPYVQIMVTGMIVILSVTITLDRSRLAFIK